MIRKPIIWAISIISLTLGAFVYQQSLSRNPEELSSGDDNQPPVQDSTQSNAQCADNSHAWQRVRELETEISQLKKKLPTAATTEMPTPDASASTANRTDPGYQLETSSHAPVQQPATAPSRAALLQWERDITKSTNSDDEDRAILKNMDLPHPDASMADARRVPDEKIRQLQGTYQGRLFFTKGTVGSLEVFFNLDDLGGKPVGTLNARINNEEGVTISKTHANSETIQLKKIEGSNALLLKLSTFEIIQIFVKDDKTNLVGNYYVRPTEDEPLKKSGEFIISKLY
jgi:hypothetical protein